MVYIPQVSPSYVTTCQNSENTGKCICLAALFYANLFYFTGNNCAYYVTIIPPTTGVSRRAFRWSVSQDRQLVCWWQFVSQTSSTVFKSSKWTLLHMIPMKCRYTWHIFVRLAQRFQSIAPFHCFKSPYCEGFFSNFLHSVNII